MSDRFVSKSRSGTYKNAPFEGLSIWDSKNNKWATSNLYPNSSRGKKSLKLKLDRMNRIDQGK